MGGSGGRAGLTPGFAEDAAAGAGRAFTARTAPGIVARPMEAVLLIGLQASGKSTFCREQFFDTHVRLHPRLLGTRERERLLLDACLAARVPFVVDDTNVTRLERAYYIGPARSAGFRVVGYFFRSRLHEALEHNRRRRASERVSEDEIRATSARIELPKLSEGFEELHFVVSHHDDSFRVEPWRD